MELGNNVKKLRVAKGISQQLLSEKANVPQTTISDIECNKGLPNISNVMKLAKALNVTLDELLNSCAEEK